MADENLNYDPQRRFKNWKCKFDNGLANLKGTDTDKIQLKGMTI